jgi:hypothetical protein
VKLSHAFKVPDSVLGYLEWCSGVLYINSAYEDFRCIEEAPESVPSDIRPLFQTISHESYHFAQAVTTGYFFRLACQALECVRKILGPLLDSEAIERNLLIPPALSSEYKALLSQLDMHSGDYLTDRAVIESAAMLFEHRVHFPDLSHEAFLCLLRAEMPLETSEYRIAYELASLRLSERAFDSVLPLCFTALCFDCPREAFRDAIDVLARDGVPDEWTLSRVQELAQALAGAHRPIGSAIEVMAGGLSHPIYSPVVMALNQGADKLSPIEMMVRPDKNTVDNYLPVVRPTLFRDGVCHVPKAFSDRYGGASANDLVAAFVVLGALAMRIGQRDESLGRFRTEYAV